jgi:hypothetical protein
MSILTIPWLPLRESVNVVGQVVGVVPLTLTFIVTMSTGQQYRVSGEVLDTLLERKSTNIA